MVQQDLNFKCSLEDFVSIHDNALPFDLMGIRDLCDKSPDMQDACEVNEESAPVPRHFEIVRSAKAS
jgi:hypothetical protein